MHREWVSVFVGLGANLGEARQTLDAAVKAIGKLPHTRVLNCSSFYRSAPVDATGPDYINAVLQISTRLSAPALLAQLHQLERGAGRERPYRNAPRTLDLDLLLYGAARIDSPTLTVPHPRMRQRAFVLRPLADIAPALVSAQELQAVSDQVIEKV